MKNSGGSTSLQYPVAVSVCIGVLLFIWHCLGCTAYLACVSEHSEGGVPQALLIANQHICKWLHNYIGIYNMLCLCIVNDNV